MNAQTAQIVTRPTEYAYKTIGTASGESAVTKVFRITVDGDKTKTSISGLVGASPEENLATYRAVKSLDGDAFFKLTTEEEHTGIPFIYSHTKIKVTGKVLKINDLGTITAERADQMDMASPQSKKEQKKGGLFGKLFN